jgi:predicted metal-dependent hydrolase
MTEVLETENRSISYRIVRSRRRTLGLEVGLDGSVVVRIPNRVSLTETLEFVRTKREWIVKSLERMQKRRVRTASVDWEAKKKETLPWIQGEGGELFRRKVASWAEIMGVSYHDIHIKDMQTRWGSCSNKRNLNFCWKVFLMPERLADYLIVHELSHILRMDHSPAFWAIVGTYIPDYGKRKKELNGYA